MLAGADLYTLHAHALADLNPELILTQDLCRVCALPSGQVSDALDYLGCRADVVSLDPYTLDEDLDTILTVGARTGVPGRAAKLVTDLRTRLAAVATAVRHLTRPRVGGRRMGRPAFHRRALGTRPGPSGRRRASGCPPRRPLGPDDLPRLVDGV
jgi:iron complex transport system substrate-binding protein